MAQATSNSLNDLATAFLIQALGLNPLLSPVLNAAGLPPGIGVSPDQAISGPAGGITAVNANLLTGIATAGSTLAFTNLLSGMANLSVQVQGAFVGTLVVQVSNDNINWTTVAQGVYNLATGAYTGSITAPGVYNVNINSFAYARITCSAFTSGAPVIFLKAGSATSEVIVTGALPAGSNLIGGAALAASATGGAPGTTQAKILTAATTNATSLKASAGKLFIAMLSNNATTARYVHLYNKASAPTVGTDSPAFTITLPPNTIAQPFVFDHDIGLAFTTGIAYSITAAAGDLDATVTAANDVTGVIGYI